MGKVIIRLTESDLHRIVNESVTRILKEQDDSFILQVVAQQLAQKGSIHAVNGTNDTDVELGNGKTAYIEFTVESYPYVQKGMGSGSYDVPSDADEIIDSPSVYVDKVEIWMNGGENSYPLEDNGIIAKTLEKVIEIDYSGMDVPNEDDYNYYEE